MIHPDVDTLTADAGDMLATGDRERVREHLDECPACLEVYSRVCAERALLEASTPGRAPVRTLAAVAIVALAAGAVWGAVTWGRPRVESPQQSIRLLASPATRAQAALELLRMGPSALAALERGAREDDAAISRACQDLLHMIAVQDPADTRTLVSAVEAAWKKIQEEAAEGNFWVDKKSFRNAFDAWKEVHKPDAEALAAAEHALLTWFESRANEKGLEWRVRRQLYESARERKDLPAAARHLDRAIAAYPDPSYQNPAKQSSFQHLVNDRAMMIWDEKGVDDAIGYAANLLSKDPRLHYFHSWPWEKRFEAEKTPAVRATMIERMRTAYASRSAQFPDAADRARDYSDELK